MSTEPETDPEPSVAQRVTELHAADPIAAALGITLVAVGDTSVQLSMQVEARHVGGHGRCHGASLFALADVAMSYVGNRFPGQAFATRAGIDFIGPVELGDVVLATANESSLRGRSALCDVTLTVDGEIVAQFRGNTLRVSDT